jgi:membrane protease YdiL (CAAX protease family)
MLANVSAALFFLLLAVVIPLLAAMSRRALAGITNLPRGAVYAEVIVLQLLLAGAAWLTARLNGIVLFPSVDVGLRELAAGGALLAIAFAFLAYELRRDEKEENDPLRLITPRRGSERLIWLAVSAAAAIGEEVTYRGVSFALLAPQVGTAGAVAISATLFGLAHLVQGVRRSILIVLFGLGFHLLVLYTGSLLTAIAVHFIYDVVAGFLIGRKHAIDHRPSDASPDTARADDVTQQPE